MRWQVGLTVFVFAWTLTTHGKYSASGDEPHFLMITQSLVADHDLDVANNYAMNDGRLFGHDNLGMGLHAIPARSGHIRSAHDIGLAVALIPVYVVAQRVAMIPSESLLTRFRMNRGLLAYSIIGLFLISVTAFGLMMLADGLATLTSSLAAALLVVAAGVSPPIVSHSFLVFPEVLALFVTCIVVWFSLVPSGPRDRTVSMWIVFALGMLPWIHHKYLLYVFGLGFVILWKRWATFRALSRGEWAIAMALFGLPQLALHLWTWREWGTLNGTLTTNDVPLSLAVLKVGAIGLWMDRQSGLLAYAPLYWIVPACWFLTGRRTWPFLVPTALLYLPAAAFTHGWWAGFSPAARYIVPLTPFFIIAIADALRHRAIRIAVMVLLIPQVVIDAVVWQRPRTLWPSATPVNAALERVGVLGRAYERVLPAAQAGESIGTALLLAAAITAGLIVLAVYGRRHRGFGTFLRPGA
ncbi:MAG: hypothetical protein EXQ59_01445 [Acidobacteria bacterium]|nr:hypothetical protein [Acidobacteriota bacterium]